MHNIHVPRIRLEHLSHDFKSCIEHSTGVTEIQTYIPSFLIPLQFINLHFPVRPHSFIKHSYLSCFVSLIKGLTLHNIHVPRIRFLYRAFISHDFKSCIDHSTGVTEIQTYDPSFLIPLQFINLHFPVQSHLFIKHSYLSRFGSPEQGLTCTFRDFRAH